ncbi:hypothetical protein ACFQ9X_47880 [Catenulispora yoronensis]
MASSFGAQSSRSHAGASSLAGGSATGSRWLYCRVTAVSDTSRCKASGSAARFAVATSPMSEASFG